MELKLIIDGGSDLPKEMIEEYKIETIPISISDGENEYLPHEIDREDFFRRMNEGVVFQTSQASLIALRDIFERHAKKGNRILYYGLSGGITSGIQTANLVADALREMYPGFEILVWDSKVATAAAELILKKFLEISYKLNSWDEVIEVLSAITKSLHAYFTVGNMKYLFRGGRLSKGTFMIGSALQIKPIIVFGEMGELVAKEKVRGFNNLNHYLVEKVLNYKPKDSPLYLMFGEDDKLIKNFSKELNKQAGEEIPYIKRELGKVILAHTGPEFFAMSFLDNEYKSQVDKIIKGR